MRAKTRGSKWGRRRVEGWINGVINPLLDALPIEMSFLERGNLTWRHHDRSLAHVRPIREYLSGPGRHILGDFERASPGDRKRFAVHDDLLDELTAGASGAFDELTSWPGFQVDVEDALRSYLDGRPGAAYPGGAIPREQFVDLMAEHLVNRILTIPDRNLDHEFWSLYGGRLLSHRTGLRFDELDRLSGALLDHDRALQKRLEDTRFDLCTEYDVPAAALPGDVEA